MSGLKIFISLVLALLLCGCSSVQVRYREKESRKSIISEYRVTKESKETWNTLQNSSFPIFRWCVLEDLGKKDYAGGATVGQIVEGSVLYVIIVVFPAIDLTILPFQALYDGIFSHRTEYDAKLVISGKIVNEIGQPMPDKKLNLFVFQNSFSISPDNQGYINGTYEHSFQDMPANKITLEIGDINANDERNAFQKGNKITCLVPLQIRYDVGTFGNAIERQDLIPDQQSNGANRDEIRTKWIPNSSQSNIISLKEDAFVSEKNREITKNEMLAENERRIQEEKMATEAKIKEEKEKQRKQKEFEKWQGYADELLVNDKLKLPTTKRLLQMAGYSNKAPIKIFRSTLSLENQLGYPILDSSYFIFAKQSTTGIEKILVIIYNHDDNSAINLLAYAPMLLYQKLPSTGSDQQNNYELAHYVSRELIQSESRVEYIVYPHKVSYYVFNYGERYRANEGDFRGNLGFDDICSSALKEVNELYGKGKFELKVGDRGKFHLTNIERIYP